MSNGPEFKQGPLKIPQTLVSMTEKGFEVSFVHHRSDSLRGYKFLAMQSAILPLLGLRAGVCGLRLAAWRLSIRVQGFWF